MSDKEQKYTVSIGLRQADDIEAILCKEGADKLFKDMATGEKFICFYCCAGDKTLLRVDEVCYLFSKKIVIGKVK